MHTTPSLWFSRDDVDAVKQRLAHGQPTATAIHAELAVLAALTPAEAAQRGAAGEATTPGDYVVASAALALLVGASRYAEHAYHGLSELNDGRNGELTRGRNALLTALASECCYAIWSPAMQADVTRRLVALHESFRTIDVTCGDPHVVTNNHWAVAHAGALIAALAAHGHPTEPGGPPCDLTEGIAWAAGRTKVFLMHHGDRGLYHEGLGYMLYPACFWLPAMIAYWRCYGCDWLQRFPGLRHLAGAVYTATVARPAVGGRIGRKLVWNDDGADWCNDNPAVLAIHLAPDDERGALRWMYDRLNGIAGDCRFAPGYGGALFALFYYPYDAEPHMPVHVLPRYLCDSRQGLCLIRNRFQDADDTVLGCYAHTTHVGGHVHDDAGSIRCMALGHDWIIGGGQARRRAEFQSIVTPADGSRAAKPYGCGAVICESETEWGGVFGMDLRRPSAGYAERWVAVDYSRRGGAEAVVALLDVLDDHAQRDWIWNLTFADELSFEPFADGTGFRLRAADGAALQAHFLGDQPASLTLDRLPDSTRTYQSGNVETYPGPPCIHAHFPFKPHLGIYVVMTVQRGVAPTVRQDTGGLAVTIGDWTWQRPFGPAIPAAFEPGVSGTLCRYPSGRPE